MHRLSVKLQLACGELSCDELHLQRRLFWTLWRLVHIVHIRKVQGVDRISRLHKLWSRDVFYNRRGLSKFDMHRLSIKLQLAC